MAQIETILVATDTSTASGAAVDEAIELASRLEADLVVMSVVTPLAAIPPVRGRPASGTLRRERQVAVELIVQRAMATGAHARSLIWEGDAGESIVTAAEAERADLIVVGSHERGAVSRFLIGSVSDYVVRHAACPVLVVRPSAAPA